MQSVILDTSFILSCIQKKIDFFEEIELMGMQVIIPKQVISEIKGIAQSKKKLKFRESAKLAIKILEKNSFKKIDLKSKNVDNGLINMANKKNYLIATLDKEIKEKVITPKLVIRGKKKLELI